MNPKKTVYISGSGHSGSTLLDMVLGGHELISNLGEVHRFTLCLTRSTEPFRCTCGSSVSECVFWKKVLVEYRKLLGLSPTESLSDYMTTHPSHESIPKDAEDRDLEPNAKNLYGFNLTKVAMVLNSHTFLKIMSRFSSDVRDNRRLIQNSLILYEAVRIAWNTPTIVDSTKTPVRLKGLYFESGEEFHIVRLIRDGRAVCASRMRRTGYSIEKSISIWKAEQRKQDMVLRGIPKRFVTVVHYEDLCRDPEKELQRICGRLGLEYSSEMLNFRKNTVHSIGGNPMRFRDGDTKIKLDEKWKNDLSSKDLETFEKLSGNFNRKLGYHD